MRGDFWAGLPIPNNPWTGADPALITVLRERIAAPELPDGPPLDAAAAARFRARLAGNIVTFVMGDDNACERAARRHIASLRR